MIRKSLVFVTLALLVLASAAQAGSSPQEQRHHLMEDVRDAAKPVSKMLKGEMDFDAATAMSSFQTWSEAAAVFGDLFPEGSETGHGTEAMGHGAGPWHGPGQWTVPGRPTGD